MRKYLFPAALAAVLAGTSLAQASDDRTACTTAPSSQWLSAQDLASKLEAQGYAVRRLELKRGCGEARLIDKNGVRTEVYFDPATGAIIDRRQRESHREWRGERHRDWR